MPELQHESKRELTFLSYAHEDLDRVRKVYAGLKKRKVDVWIDKEDLGPGKWKPQIMRTIPHSKYFIFCVSNAALEKTSFENPGFVDKELQTAWEIAQEQDGKSFTILPVRLEDCDRGDMRLSGWQQYDLFEDWEKGLDKLAVDIGGISLADERARDERTENEKIVAGMKGKGDMFSYSGDYEKALSI
ncbi:MAG: toll/interleukin-1 receptor domain-containing protein, partial [bacterium]|nr:toll/interleukin-1 receptor domain-containing protein [bacterium]